MKTGEIVVVAVSVAALFIVTIQATVSSPPTRNGAGNQPRFFFDFLPSIGNLTTCPLNRTFVRQGFLCFRVNSTEVSCQNETCICRESPPILPFRTFPTWNCTSDSNSTVIPRGFDLPPFTFPTLPPFPLVPTKPTTTTENSGTKTESG